MSHKKYIAVLLLAALLPLAHSAHALGPGDAAPQFTLSSTKDESISSSSLVGKVVYLDLWASWCGSCRKTFPLLKELQEKFRAQGFEVVAINLDKKRENADKFLNEFSPNFTVLLDPSGEVPKNYEMKALPSSYLIDRNGKIVQIFEGTHGITKEDIDAAVRNSLAH